MVFEELFKASDWQPIDYEGKILMIADSLPVSNDIEGYKITFEIAKSNWEQGIFISSKGAYFQIDNKEEKINGFHLWYDGLHNFHIFKLLKKGTSDLKVWNIWRIENGPMSYGHNGAALYTEQLINGKRFYCNDGYPDTDLDDLIFQITWLYKSL